MQLRADVLRLSRLFGPFTRAVLRQDYVIMWLSLRPIEFRGCLLHKLGASSDIHGQRRSSRSSSSGSSSSSSWAWLGGLSASRSERANRSHGGVIDTSQKHREAAAHEEARQTALDELSRPRASDPCLANDK